MERSPLDDKESNEDLPLPSTSDDLNCSCCSSLHLPGYANALQARIEGLDDVGCLIVAASGLGEKEEEEERTRFVRAFRRLLAWKRAKREEARRCESLHP